MTRHPKRRSSHPSLIYYQWCPFLLTLLAHFRLVLSFTGSWLFLYWFVFALLLNYPDSLLGVFYSYVINHSHKTNYKCRIRLQGKIFILVGVFRTGTGRLMFYGASLILTILTLLQFLMRIEKQIHRICFSIENNQAKTTTIALEKNSWSFNKTCHLSFFHSPLQYLLNWSFSETKISTSLINDCFFHTVYFPLKVTYLFSYDPFRIFSMSYATSSAFYFFRVWMSNIFIFTLLHRYFNFVSMAFLSLPFLLSLLSPYVFLLPGYFISIGLTTEG